MSGPDKIYQQGLAQGDFNIQHCRDCKSYIFFPRVACPECGSTDLTWEKASGKGAVYSMTTTRRKPDRGGDFNLSIIELAEGPRLMSKVEGISPDEVKIGMDVVAKITTKTGGDEEEYFVVFEALGVREGT